MCKRKTKHSDESSGFQYCTGHMKRYPAYSCTYSQAIEIQAERAKMREENQALLRAGRERPLLKLLNKQQRVLGKNIKKEWGATLSWLSKAVVNSLECWEATLPLYRDSGSQLGITLHMLHGQAGVLAHTITHHCRSGEIQSAIILWRSLFEIEINMAYIARDTTQVPSRAQRYYDWSIANYFYVNDLLTHETMVELQRKYHRWSLKHYDGWTAPPDNPKSTLDTRGRALRVGYEEGNKREGKYSRLDIYDLSHSYVHNNMFGMLNDLLTPRSRLPNAPSIVGLDTPICLTAISLSTVTRLLLDTFPDSGHENELRRIRRFADIQESQVLLEVGRVRPELLSPLGGVDLSFTVQSEDGTEYTARPARRGEH